jgi:hypothetical protein
MECAKAEAVGTPKANAAIKMTRTNVYLPGEPIIDFPCALSGIQESAAQLPV